MRHRRRPPLTTSRCSEIAERGQGAPQSRTRIALGCVTQTKGCVTPQESATCVACGGPAHHTIREACASNVVSCPRHLTDLEARPSHNPRGVQKRAPPPLFSSIASSHVICGKATDGTRDQSYTQEGCAARSRQGSVTRVSKQRAHSVGSAAAAAVARVLSSTISSTMFRARVF